MTSPDVTCSIPGKDRTTGHASRGSSPTHGKTSPASLLRRATAVFLCLLTGLALMSASPGAASADVTVVGGQPGPITVYTSGAPGLWRYTYGPFIGCQGGASMRYVMMDGVAVGYSPNYSPSRQDVYVKTDLYRWTGSSWSLATGTGWQHHFNWSDGRSSWAAFRSAQFTVKVGGSYWRVAQTFQWYVGSTKVGEVVNLYNGQSYVSGQGNSQSYGDTGYGYCWIG